jgi:hypothetical protein
MDRSSKAAYLAAMPTAPAALILDLLEWLAPGPRGYAEAMDAWRTSCPRLTVWEDAVDGGYVARRASERLGVSVELTEAGRAFLRRERGAGASASTAARP